MSSLTDEIVQKRLRLGALGALAAVTILWLARFDPILLPIGTVLLTVSMVPLTAGYRVRGGFLFGLLFGVLWVASRLDMSRPVGIADVFNVGNVLSVIGILALGVLSGVFFGSPGRSSSAQPSSDRSPKPERDIFPPPARPRSDFEAGIRSALKRQAECIAEMGGQQSPWVAFDNHLREVLRELTGARRIRCYHVNGRGELEPLNGATPAPGVGTNPQHPLLNHVLTTGRPFLASSPTTGPMIQELANSGEIAYAWALPIRLQDKTCGLITVGELGNPLNEDQLALVGGLISEFWHHFQLADRLRVASLLDRPSGVLNRVEILGMLDQTVERCYADHEPVVILALSIEGIRSMDDGGQWDMRNEVVEIIGQSMAASLRQDDVIGRFSDARFIAVLRRLDVPLAHLIARKILNTIGEKLETRFPQSTPIVRAGLAGSGFERVPAQTLLMKAFEGITESRAHDVTLLPYMKGTLSTV